MLKSKINNQLRKIFDKISCAQEIGVNDEVLVRNYNRINKDKWSTGIVIQQTWHVSYHVLSEEKIVRRYKNHLCKTSVDVILNLSSPIQSLWTPTTPM